MTTIDLFSFANIPAVEINWIAIIVAVIAAQIIGFVWYGPLFSKQWLVLVKMSKEDAQKQAKNAMAMGVLASVITAFVLAHVVSWVGATDVIAGITAGLIVGIGFSATVLAVTYGYTQKPMNLFWIDAGNQLVSLAVMGAIIAAWA